MKTALVIITAILAICYGQAALATDQYQGHDTSNLFGDENVNDG